MTFPKALQPSIELFKSLRADDETLWNLLFVPPAEFSRVTGQGSIIIFGEPGSGKTMLFKILQSLNKGIDEKSTHLLAFWRPAPISADVKENAAVVQRLVSQVLDACGMALISHIAQHPCDFDQADAWVQNLLAWFIRKSIRGSLATRLGPLMKSSVSSASTLQHIQSMAVEDVLYDPSPEQMIAELISGLQQIGIEGIWILSDGLEGWADAAPEQLSRNLTSFLSALSLFEHTGMIFKLFIPSHLETEIIRASGVLRRRVDAYKLSWSAVHLQKIVEKRLALLMGKESFSLPELCDAPELIDWLDRVGGNSPREWLDQIEPLVTHYIENSLSSPISFTTWKNLRINHPPYFWMDENGKKVKVGGREIPLDDVPPKAYDMLRYLYRHSGQVITKDELYYLVYLGMGNIPRSAADPGYESPNIFAGLIDTSIYRIRQAIEPDPAEPVLLQTVRGHGVKLVSRL